MTYYTVVLGLGGDLADAVAVEWTNHPTPLDSGQGWEPCLRQPDGSWRFASHDPDGAAHRLAPGAFAGLAIRYRLEAAGSWSAAAEPRKDIVIRAEGEVVVTPLPPLLIAAPTLVGAGTIGTELAAEPGAWSGTPAPDLGFQWRRDGVEIPGAVARSYLTGPADDRCALDCVISARNLAGVVTAIAGPIAARYLAPRLVGALPEEVFDEGTGPQAVETAFVFTGEALVFAAAGAAIDARSGVLRVPTDAPVSGSVVTVTATNSGGAAEARLLYTVEATPERPLEAADVTVLRSVWRPEGQTRTFSPEVAFPGLAAEPVDAIEFCADPLNVLAPAWHPVRSKADEPGAWRLFDADHPVSTAEPDAALWVEGDARAAGRLRFRWRSAQLQDWSEPGATHAVPTPPAPAPTLGELLTPTTAETQAAMEHPPQAYKVDVSFTADNEGVAIQNGYAHCPVPLLALEAFAGQTRTFSSQSGAFRGARTGRARLLDHMRHWLNDRAPAGRSGYNAQYEAQFVAAAAILRATPAVWDLPTAQGGLTDAEKTRLDLVMKGCALGSCWVISDENPHFTKRLQGRERTVRGYKAQRGHVPNYSLPPRLIPFVVDAYMRLSGETLQGFLTSFDRDAFAASVGAAGKLTDLHDTYRQQWTLDVMRAAHPGMIETYAPGPTKAQLEAALRDDFPGGVFTTFGFDLDRGHGMFMAEFDRFFSRIVRPGPSVYGNNIPLPGAETGPGWTTSHGLKTPSPIGRINEFQLRGCLGGVNDDANRTTNKAAWANLPNPGALGMMFELDANDGGGGGNPPIRSCTAYAYHGASAFANLTAAAIVLGVIDRTDPAFSRPGGHADRMRVGVTDFLYRTEHGHREYSKGAQSAPNYEWDTGFIEGNNARFDTWRGLWRMIDRWTSS